ncbi:MAG: sensor histidine kinase, partial [Solirubrobacterales bacterium]
KQSEEALRELNATLENRVAERTEELEHRTWQLEKLALELSEAEDRERKRLAEILHDDLQQQLAAAKFHVGLISSRVKDDPSLQQVAATVDQMLMEAVQTSRSLSHELFPAMLQHGTLTQAIEWLAGQMQTKHGLLVHVDAVGPVESHSDTLKSFLYRAVQELLFNVVKHAGVKEARVQLRRTGRYLGLSVSDQGRGFDPQTLRAAKGFGLFSVHERVELMGGRMKIRSAEGQGTTFSIAIADEPVSIDEQGRTP